MRKIVLFFSLLISLSHAASPQETTIANILASYDIIVDNSKNPTNYRLTDTITRAEAIGVALRVGNINLPEKYFCRNYFRDVVYNPVNNWVCRAIEIAADNEIISRENSVARSSAPISRIESLAITMRAGKIPYARNVDRANYPKDMPQWQIDILEGALQYRIISSNQNFGPDMLATRIDVFGMIYNMRFSGKKKEYITDIGVPLHPLGSAPNSTGGINVKIPRTSTETTSPHETKTELVGFAVTAPSNIQVGTPFDITIRALGNDNSTLTNYTGTVYFDLITGSSSDISPLITEEGLTFSLDNKGTMTLRNITLKKAGNYEIDVYEIGSGLDLFKTFTISATSPVLLPSVVLSSIIVVAPREVTVNSSFDVTISAHDKAGQVMTNYVGTVYFTKSGISSTVEFPLQSYTFTAADKGKRTFSGFKLKQAGAHELVIYEVDVIPNGTTRTVSITAKTTN